MGRGKYPLLDEIKKHLPQGDCLIEPFVGAGSVFLNTDYSRYILADINSDLISLYNIVKTQTDEYVQQSRDLFTPESNQSEVYYQLRDEFNQSQDPFRRALLFLYLNRHGYNGLCRYNLRGEFNVPFGRYRKPYFPEDELYHFAERRVTRCLFAKVTPAAWRARSMARWCIAIRPMRRFPPPQISPRTTPTVLISSSNSISPIWLMGLKSARFRC